MKLTVLQVKNAKATTKQTKMADGSGMFLLVHPNGSKYWRLKYYFAGKEKILALGVYPHVSLSDARERVAEAKKLLANNADPGLIKKTQKLEAVKAAANTFEAVALEWHEKQSAKWVPQNAARNRSILVRNVFPYIGIIPISQVTAAQLLDVLKRIEKRGIIETAHRTMQICGQIFRYAIATGRAQADLSLVLKGALTPVKEKHHASITDPKKVGDLLLAIDGYEGSFVTQCALKLAPMLFVRPGELRHAEWEDFSMDGKAAPEWRIPAIKMKMNDVHIVPLATQAVDILKALHEQTGHAKYVFPGVRTTDRPMSENTVNAALRRLGYSKDEMTGHGFRSMASTILHEQGWPHEAIERQLAHAERNKVSAAYNYAQHLEKRREIMQNWADYLDALKVK
jgi:integrase